MTLVETYFPFYRFNLRQNPFGTLSEVERLRVTVLPPSVAAALQTGSPHIQVLGRKGRGKSTALHYMVQHFRRAGLVVAYERLPRFRWRYHTNLGEVDMFALDEMQRIAPWESLRLFREMRGKRLLIGSHANHALAFRVRGLPLATIRLGQQASQARLAAILKRRLEVFRLDETQPPGLWFDPAAVGWLWGQFKSDLRHMNFFLYDVFQHIEQPGGISAATLAAHQDRNSTS